jgi:hypothetical protein
VVNSRAKVADGVHPLYHRMSSERSLSLGGASEGLFEATTSPAQISTHRTMKRGMLGYTGRWMRSFPMEANDLVGMPRGALPCRLKVQTNGIRARRFP